MKDMKVLSPDLEVPSAELRKEAYELALSVWDMMPWVDFFESVFKTLCAFDMRPEHFASTSRKMEAILKGLCATDFKGSKVFEHASCDSAKAAFADISARLFGR